VGLVHGCARTAPFGTIPRLLKWFDSNPECRDLLTGPLLSNQLFPIATHFSNKWSGEMWGTWALPGLARVAKCLNVGS